MKKRNSSELKRKMMGHWLNALYDLAPSLHYAISNVGDSVPCPVDGGTDGFRLFDLNDKYSTAETGGGVKHSFRVFAEGIDLLMWVNRWSFPETYDALENWMGDRNHISVVNSLPIKTKEVSPIDETKIRKWLNSVWDEAVPMNDPMAEPARQYFASRNILKAGLSAKSIRFHPNLTYTDKQRKYYGTFPAILALVGNNDNQHVGIHRTYLTENGQLIDLGNTNKPKKMTPTVMKHSKGRHARLFSQTGGFIGISEGLETALSVYEAKKFPVWPCKSATNIATFVPPSGIHTVIHFMDKDRSKAGEIAAEKLKERLMPLGFNLINLVPPAQIPEGKKSVDWADMLSIDIRSFDIIDDIISSTYFKSA